MKPQIDMTDVLTVTSSSYGTTEYNYVRKDRYYAIVQEISIATDSNFRSNGDIKGFIGGQEITAQNAVEEDISPLGNLDIKFEGAFKPVLQPGQSVHFDFKDSAGTGKVQVLLHVTLVTEQELASLRSRGVIA